MMKRKTKPKKKPTRKPKGKTSQQMLVEVQAARLWLGRLDGAMKFLRKLSALPPNMKDKWARGNWDYYHRQVMTLLESPPRGVEKVIAKTKRELKDLRL